MSGWGNSQERIQPHETSVIRLRRKHVQRASLLALSAGVLIAMGAPAGPAGAGVTVLDMSCPAGNVCAYTGTSHAGQRVILNNTSGGYHPTGIDGYSAKNHYASRKVVFADGAAFSSRCVPAGAEPIQLGFPARQYNIGQPGSHC